MNNKVIGMVAALLICFATQAGAASVGWSAGIKTILVSDTAYGGCMAQLDPPPSSKAGLNCPTAYVTFNCLGLTDPNAPSYVPSKSVAQTLLQSTQLGFVTDTQVYVRAFDGVKVDGHCLGTLVQSTKTAYP